MAVQNPRTAFFDSELKQGKVAETNLGLPLALSGGFALTYMITTPKRKLAIRCFHRQVPSAEKKYDSITRKVNSLGSGYFVDFEFQSSGIMVRNNRYPIVKMDWVDGDTLGVFLDKNIANSGALRKLRAECQSLATFLAKNSIAHGDIQNGNVMVSNGTVRLIDYDGMYVPGLPTGNGTKTGHKHFQHPGRRADDYGPEMDRFAFIAVDLSLQAITADATLYKRYREGGETIIFKANDFADPENSEIFRILAGKAELKDHTRSFSAICQADLKAVPHP